MIRETTRRNSILSLAMVLVGGTLTGCLAETEPVSSSEPDAVADVGEVGSELGAAGSNGDGWKFPNQRGDRHNRNFCPLVAAFANPSAIKVGQKLNVTGFAFDFDRRPQALTFKWAASPTNRGTFDSSTAKSTKFKCTAAGNVKLTFSASDGDCTRSFSVTVNCKPVTTPVCGNGVIEGNEICDGNCPTTCNDNKACTTDKLTGSASTCNAVCSSTPITVCKTGDGCCPTSCTNANDAECPAQPPRCGDGIVQGAETCDGNCPASCEDGIACTKDVRTGTAEACNVVCAHTQVTACSRTADGCCPTGCNGLTDADCNPVCGNSAIEAGETCDPQSSCPTSCNDNTACTKDTLNGAASTCNAACTFTTITACASGDGCCPSGCARPADNDCPPALPCGNGTLDQGETCDNSSPTKCPTTCDDGIACTQDVPSGSAATCTFACQHPAITVCNGTTDSCCPGGCNTGNDPDCTMRCGDGRVDPPETCDGNCPTSCADTNPCTEDASTGSAAECTLVCTHTPITTPACLCGNGRIDQGEACDGNCPTTCEDSNPCTTDTLEGSATACTAKCTHTPISSPACLCGNGQLDNGEKCDNSSTTTCPTMCTASSNVCTPNRIQGTADTCSAECVSTELACGAAGDMCCPPNCTSGQDADCTDACATCHARDTDGFCVQPLADCDALQGVTGPTNPFRPNMPRNQLCREIVTCMETKHCAATAATDCLCGAGVDVTTCFARSSFDQMEGACDELIAAGAETTNVTELAVRISLSEYAVGAAVAVIEICDQLSCRAECL